MALRECKLLLCNRQIVGDAFETMSTMSGDSIEQQQFAELVEKIKTNDTAKFTERAYYV